MVISRFYTLLNGSFLLQKMKPKNVVLAFSEWFEKFIRESYSGKRLLPNGKKIRLGTLLQYKMVYQLVLEFEQRTGKRLRICLLNRAGLRFPVGLSLLPQNLAKNLTTIINFQIIRLLC